MTEQSLEKRVGDIEARMSSLMILDPKLWKRALAAYGYMMLATLMIYAVFGILFMAFMFLVLIIRIAMGDAF